MKKSWVCQMRSYFLERRRLRRQEATRRHVENRNFFGINNNYNNQWQQLLEPMATAVIGDGAYINNNDYLERRWQRRQETSRRHVENGDFVGINNNYYNQWRQLL